MYLHLIQQTRLEVLPHDLGTSPDPDVFFAGGGLGLLEASLDPIGDEDVGRTASPGERFSRLVSEHEYRHLEGRRVPPRLHANVEHPPAHQDRSRPGVQLIENVSVSACLGAEHPIVQPSGIVTQWVANALSVPGDEAVQRHRYIEVN